MSENKLNSLKEKPLWLRPPWSILFDIIKLRHVKPWSIDLSYLLDSLLKEMKEEGSINFIASGTALYSSAAIFKMKSDLILKLEEPPSPPKKIEDVVPPPIQLPFRYEYTFMTMKQLIESLEVVLKGESISKLKSPLFYVETAPPAIQKIDKFMANIDKYIQDMYQKIFRLTKDEGEISFSQLTTGMGRLDIIRTFILILFLVCRGKIKLRQDEELGEIYISTLVNSIDTSQAP